MHAALERLTVVEARAFEEDRGALMAWARGHGIPYVEALSEVMERVMEVVEVRDDPRRKDAAALRAFVARVERFPPRIEQVVQLCLQEGLSLAACAARLGISRETVRVHLRRLRAMQRRAAARRHGAAW